MFCVDQNSDTLGMAPSAPRTRATAALRMKQISLDNQDLTIRRLRAQLATERRGLAATKKELKETQVALEASHKQHNPSSSSSFTSSTINPSEMICNIKSYVSPVARGTRSQMRSDTNFWDRISPGVRELCHNSRRLSHSLNTKPLRALLRAGRAIWSVKSRAAIAHVLDNEHERQIVYESSELNLLRLPFFRNREGFTRRI
ncbi:hypothetical protein F511_36637 [Dorcoceras hygrometricum]|uniref:Uncharacterized protein n=1 Tax=Dorcoceras hygrometricum TaxID=472368 RepID=A0A2Z7CXG8_9LAMI|nr:hypothetical protein F511_36637 [Dorcoceras hygrometricum]